MITTHVSLDPDTVDLLSPTEVTESGRNWISPFAVPRSAEVNREGPGQVRSIRFHYLGGEDAEKSFRAVPLDQQTDPSVDLLFSGPTGTVMAVECKSPADAVALAGVAERMTARAREESLIARRLSMQMTARVLKVWRDRFAGVGSGELPQSQVEDAKMLVTKMFDQGELIIELVQPYMPDSQTGQLTRSGLWMALIHNGSVSWFSGGPVMDSGSRRAALYDTKDEAFKAAVDFAKTRGLREA
jgi:hypothetical protein